MMPSKHQLPKIKVRKNVFWYMIRDFYTLVYETGGSDCWVCVFCVAKVSKEVTPRVTRAGVL